MMTLKKILINPNLTVKQWQSWGLAVGRVPGGLRKMFFGTHPTMPLETPCSEIYFKIQFEINFLLRKKRIQLPFLLWYLNL